jgi:hypothetical protein
MTNIFSYYEQGLERLLGNLNRKPTHYTEVLTLQARLMENIAQARHYGDNEVYRTGRAQILAALNQVALEAIGKSFNELCEFSEPDASFPTIVEGAQTPSCIRLIEKDAVGEARRIESHNRLITIGRAPRSTVCIPDRTVSWEHGQIILVRGAYYYHHLSTSNPSILRRRGEERLLRPGKKEEVLLRNQDRLVIGNSVFVVEFDLIAEDVDYITTAKHEEDD